MKNVKKAHDLVPGDVVSSGETVVGATKCYTRKNGPRQYKMAVTLRKGDKVRRTLWGYNSSIFMA